MGNRAVIIEKSGLTGDGKIKGDTVGIYLHWNGGRDSVEAFLAYCDAHGYRNPTDDPAYGWAMLTTVIGNFFGDGLSLGVNTAENLDCNNMDNGVYVIEGWNIVGRLYFDGKEQTGHDLEGMMQSIDASQPGAMQLGRAKIKAYVEAIGNPLF